MAQETTRIPGVYVWEPAGSAVAVHIGLDTIDRMLQDVMRGFGAVPKRGAEVGGILLGHVEDQTVVIDDYTLVPIEYKRGPSFLFSQADAEAFASAVEGSPNAVGYFRSHTRNGVGLSAEDVALLDQYFPKPNAVALVIRPHATKVSEAGFYFRQNGRFPEGAPTQEFPFRRRELEGDTGETRPRARRDAPPARGPAAPSPAAATAVTAAAPAMPGAATGMPRPAPPMVARDEPAPIASAPPQGMKQRWLWLPLSFIFLLLGILLGFEAAVSVKPEIPAGPADPYNLDLTVTRNGDNLQIRWDRQSLAVRTALRGTFTIEDGAYNKTIDLDAGQLQNGSVVYPHHSGHVRFRLEVFPRERDGISETVDWRQ